MATGAINCLHLYRSRIIRSNNKISEDQVFWSFAVFSSPGWTRNKQISCPVLM